MLCIIVDLQLQKTKFEIKGQIAVKQLILHYTNNDHAGIFKHACNCGLRKICGFVHLDLKLPVRNVYFDSKKSK